MEGLKVPRHTVRSDRAHSADPRDLPRPRPPDDPSAAPVTARSLSLRHPDDVFVLSPEALDCLRGHLLAARSTWSAHLAEQEATSSSAPSDPFGHEVRQLAKTLIAHIRHAIRDIDHTLERLVQTYGSCEWCDTVIPVGQLHAPRHACVSTAGARCSSTGPASRLDRRSRARGRRLARRHVTRNATLE